MCSICLNHEFKCYNLQDIYKKEYEVNCECNIKVHKNCVNEWIALKNTCPICNKRLTKQKKFECFSFIIGIINIFVGLISILVGFITLIDVILFNNNVNIHVLFLIMNRTETNNEPNNETNNNSELDISQILLIILSILCIPIISIMILWLHYFL